MSGIFFFVTFLPEVGRFCQKSDVPARNLVSEINLSYIEKIS